jgi:hypothetical protein
MTDHRFASRDKLDEDVVEALRGLIAPPGGESYWSELESSIMARLDTSDIGWWGELTGWARPALVAAAVLVITATAAMLHRSQERATLPYENVVATGSSLPLPEELTVRPVAQGDREATLRFLFAY